MALARKPTSNVATNEKGISEKYVFRLIGSGQIIADTPRISKMLATLEPKIFPSANCELPSKLAIRFTSSSGKLVPNDTMVNPITISDILNRFPIAEAPSTSKSAPLIRITNPTTNNKYSTTPAI